MAVTVKVDELPARIDKGFAKMLTVGVSSAPAIWKLSHPQIASARRKPGMIARQIRRSDWRMLIVLTVFSF